MFEFPYEKDDSYILFLRKHRNKLFHLLPYNGNSGDELIKKGTRLLLSDLEIQTTDNKNNADVLLWPGGNPTMWSANINNIRKYLNDFPCKIFIIGPATFKFGHTKWINLFKNSESNREIALFARDKESFKNLKNVVSNNNVCFGLSHDPAFYLFESTWAQKQKESCNNQHILISFRTDHEGTFFSNSFCKFSLRLLKNKVNHPFILALGRMQKKKNEKKIKLLYQNQPVITVDAASNSFDKFMELLKDAKEIHTDRLHITIASIMLGKKVKVYNTLYGKIEKVLTHSLNKELLHNVEFITLS